MDSAPDLLRNHPYGGFIDQIEKPARYVGGEVGSVVKDWSGVEATFCLAFPDVYDIGMSHLGFKILYKLLNDDARTLAERCYCPWVDMEKALRARGLPLVSLETARPLRDFDVVGFSLQFELTYSNILTMLDLGGIPLRAADRGEDDPLVVGGGPTATHPEPVAPFIDAFVIGDGEEKATEVALAWARMRKAGVPRRDRLVALSKLGAVYVPSLYATRVEPATGLAVVSHALVEGAPLPIDRSLVDLNKYPFPDLSPTGGPEAIFDRLSIEIARGCTEGCRFCQAGMIYRPVRERDPEQIVDTVLRAVKRSGQDEVSLTALSTADVSCISPLVKTVARRLAEQRISLGVSSLRAYGLEPELLDELKQVRATGLTFAPEAGSQRMRDVVNKNVTEEQLHETAERVFSRGWGKMKLYFMVGLPTETDDDVRGIVETGIRTVAVGKRAAKGRGAEVTVSVSTHVPKPHTPFQWAAMDSLAEVGRKQQILRDAARGHRAVKLKVHEANASVLEGIFARGDRPLADVLERAWRHGARFDSWDDQLRLDLWEEAFTFFGVDRARYLGTLPVTATLPWTHIDVGLDDGFLASEYRRALQDRLSPPCGKVAGAFIHHDNVASARADERRLVCYDCGVACDMTKMRDERITFLEKLEVRGQAGLGEAETKRRSLPIVPAPVLSEEPVKEEPAKKTGTKPRGGFRYRFRYQKTGAMALLGHLDMVRELPRVLRRVGAETVYTNGFHPKPDMSFAPALSLGVMSLDEYADIRLAADLDPDGLARLCETMTRESPAGLAFTAARKLERADGVLAVSIAGARYVIAFARSALTPGAGQTAEAWVEERARETMIRTSIPFVRRVEGLGKTIDVRRFLTHAALASDAAKAELARAGLAGDLVALEVEAMITGSGGVKASELAAVIAGDGVTAPPHRAVRVELFGLDEAGRFSPMTEGRGMKPVASPSTETPQAVEAPPLG